MRLAITLCLILAYSAPAYAAETSATPDASDPQAGDAAFVPPGATNVLNSRDGGGLTVGFVTQMTPADLIAFYRPLLEKAGWQFTDDLREGGMRMLLLNKGEKGEGMLALSPKRGMTTVLLNLKE